MILKTQEYDKFKFRLDNRAVIKDCDVEKLMRSIKARNLLHLKPIDVNKDFEVIDGQHRLLAAQRLKVDVYYRMSDELTPKDIITLNVSKNWAMRDYLNYYVKNNYPEYVKFNDFIESNGLQIRIAFRILMGNSQMEYITFKEGNFKFINSDVSKAVLDMCNQTIKLIKKHHGFCEFTRSTRFWRSLLCLFQHESFNYNKWIENLGKLIERVTLRANEKEYKKMILKINTIE